MEAGIVFAMAGGMGLLLYGMQIMSEGLQRIAGARLRVFLSTLTHNRLTALMLGAAVTVLFQSSTATTVILVGLSSASIITLRQALGVILGSDIGTTVTAQLIALKVTEIALPVVGLGAVVMFFMSKNYRRFGQVLMGFGLLFLGLKILSESMGTLRNEPFFLGLMAQMGDNPWLALVLAAAFTFLIHSSAASVGIIMVMAIHELISLQAAIYLLFGANIGTSFTALISALGSPREAKRVATAHLAFKVAGVLLFLPFARQYGLLIESLASSPAYQVANAHTIFNIVIAVLFLPFLDQFAAVLSKLLPDRELKRESSFLDFKLLETPAIALGLATKEISRMFDLVMEMSRDIVRTMEQNDLSLLNRLEIKEKRVDALFREIGDYLARVLRQPHSRQEFLKCLGLINIIKDLEHIGDIIEKYMTGLASYKIQGYPVFSNQDWEEISMMHKKVMELMQMANTSFLSGNRDLARVTVELKPEITRMERHLRVLHIQRLRNETEQVGAAFLDMINALLGIAEQVRNIALEVANEGLEIGAGGKRVETTSI